MHMFPYISWDVLQSCYFLTPDRKSQAFKKSVADHSRLSVPSMLVYRERVRSGKRYICNFRRLLEDIDCKVISKIENNSHGHCKHAHAQASCNCPCDHATSVIGSICLTPQSVQGTAQTLCRSTELALREDQHTRCKIYNHMV